jgi:serine/threonine protein kinase
MRDSLHAIGDRVGDRYQLTALLGHGGMGHTYAATDLTTHQAVAIKVVSLRQAADWKTLELFEREAKVLQSIDHPQIPDYLDYFHIDSGPDGAGDRCFYLVQELAPGDSLADWVARGWHTDESGVKDLAVQLLRILNYLHCLRPPVVHRDIKPHNILRCGDGRLYLVDFGAVQAVYGNTLTHGGTFVGTYGYMPPEQFRGKAYFASDLYAVGATLMFVLTGRSPSDLPQRRMKIDVRDCVNLSPELTHWLEKMLEPAVEDRFHSAQEALRALEQPRPTISPATRAPVRPAHSQIRLTRSPSTLTICFSRPQPPDSLSLGLSGGVAIAVILLWFGLSWVGIGLALITGGAIAARLTSHCTLTLTPASLTRHWSILGLRGQDIDSIDHLLATARADTTAKSLALFTNPIHSCLWAQWLKPGERRWLAREISQFLQTQPSS